jgi:hypothetical protein
VSGVHGHRGGAGAGGRCGGRGSVLRGLVGTGAPPIRLTGLLVVAIVLVALMSPSPAAAAIVNPKLGEVSVPAGTGNLLSESVAVSDANGHIYVGRAGQGEGSATVYDFSSASDTSPTVWNGSNTPAGSFGGGEGHAPRLAVAVDNSTGDVYVADSIHAVVDKFDADGNLIASFGDTVPTADGQLAGLDTPAGSFSPAGETAFGIAVDQATGDLYVIDAGHEVIDAFTPEGEFLPTLSIAGEPDPFGCGGGFTDGIAVDSVDGDLLISDSCDLKVYAFSLATGTLDLGFGDHVVPAGEPNEGEPDPDGTLSGRETPAGNFGNGYTSVAAVDSSGEIYVNDTANEVVDRYSADGAYSGHQITGRPSGSNGGLAIGEAASDLYVANGGTGLVEIFGPPVVLADVVTAPASGVNITSATLNGEVNPAELPVTGCFFEYGETTAYGKTAECDPVATELGAGKTLVAVRAEVTGLRPGATYHYRLAAANANGTNRESGDQSLFTGATILSTSVSGVSATAATLETEIDPNGIATNYHLEYDTVPYGEGEGPHGASTPMPPVPLGAGTVSISRSAQIQGLTPLTTYHFRAVAESLLGTVTGPDSSFTTQGAVSPVLLDGRVWELVSPPDKHGIPLEGIAAEGGLIQAAADGDALTYIAKGPIDAKPAGNRSSQLAQLIANRDAGHWTTQDLTTPHQAPLGVLPGTPSEYEQFSPNLELSAVQPGGATPLSPNATEKTLYLRLPSGRYQPLVTPEDVPAGVKFGGAETGPEVFSNSLQYRIATPDLSHVLFSSPALLTSDFAPGFENPFESTSIYEWSEGAIRLISWLPVGEAPLCRTGDPGQESRPSPDKPCQAGVSLGFGDSQMRNALSSSGGRVVFNSRGHLYLRDVDRGETLMLDAPDSGCGTCGEGGGRFQIANTDGSKIFFTDGTRLTTDSAASPGEPDLYMCQVEIVAAGLSCSLSDLTVASSQNEPADVLGGVIGAAEDGSSIYFVANGSLTSGEGDARGDCAVSAPGEFLEGTGDCNLYRLDTVTRTTRLVAVLSGQDFNDWAAQGEGLDLGALTARVSPDGRFIAFMSARSLTGYENRDVVSDARDQEVYLYDAHGSGSGRLSCASCNPTGARPRGLFDDAVFPGPLVDRTKPNNWGGQTLAASVPGWTRIDVQHAIYQSRYLSDNGRLFFNAADALVPQDTNGTEDVYEYEPPQGEGQPPSNNCTTASPTYGPASGGCVSLVSSGTSPEESAFLDASEDGNDVFFLTAAKLSRTDTDAAYDIYDASAGGHAVEPSTVIECAGDGCQQPATSPSHPTPGTALLDGPGNLTQCPKGKVKQKGKCVKKKQKKTKKHKKGKKKNSNKKKGKGKKNKRAAGHERGGQK